MRKLVVLLRGAIVKSSVDLGISAQLSHTLFWQAIGNQQATHVIERLIGNLHGKKLSLDSPQLGAAV